MISQTYNSKDRNTIDHFGAHKHTYKKVIFKGSHPRQKPTEQKRSKMHFKLMFHFSLFCQTPEIDRKKEL